ncbi:hypothetical protein GCM10010392_55350 [Streptomyces clavifer]|nr:hypothetical protein GCM10010392_55350 [Streptomyces clavifer]
MGFGLARSNPISVPADPLPAQAGPSRPQALTPHPHKQAPTSRPRPASPSRTQAHSRAPPIREPPRRGPRGTTPTPWTPTGEPSRGRAPHGLPARATREENVPP